MTARDLAAVEAALCLALDFLRGEHSAHGEAYDRAAALDAVSDAVYIVAEAREAGEVRS